MKSRGFFQTPQDILEKYNGCSAPQYTTYRCMRSAFKKSVEYNLSRDFSAAGKPLITRCKNVASCLKVIAKMLKRDIQKLAILIQNHLP